MAAQRTGLQLEVLEETEWLYTTLLNKFCNIQV